MTHTKLLYCAKRRGRIVLFCVQKECGDCLPFREGVIRLTFTYGDLMEKRPDYANWISTKGLMIFGVAGLFAILLLILTFTFGGGGILIAIRCVLALCAAILLIFFAYLIHARRLLDYNGGGIQGRVLDNLLANLDWNGKGRLLDIGCGSGALAIKAARKFPEAQITGIDYWGAIWDYALEQCEDNAKLEGVADRTNFQKGDAAGLDFPDATFDAVVSNLVFHEVRSQPDKLALIREALRVLKPNGVFALEDIFFSKGVYGDIGKIVQTLSGDVSSITFVDTRECDFFPVTLKTPLVLGNVGLIKGRK